MTRIYLIVSLITFTQLAQAGFQNNNFSIDENSILEEHNVFLYDGNNLKNDYGQMKKKPQRPGFPRMKVSTRDPVNGDVYDSVYIGETFKAGWFKDYTHWRYITVYDSEFIKKRMHSFSAISEDCHDKGWNTGSWDQTIRLEVSINAKASAMVLGIGAEVSTSISVGNSFSVKKAIQGTYGLKAVHVPYKITESQLGVTYIQVYNEESGVISFIKKPGFSFNNDESLRVNGKDYPFLFELTGQNPVFHVERERVEICADYKGETTTDNASILLDLN
jgi:hypothetical protein